MKLNFSFTWNHTATLTGRLRENFDFSEIWDVLWIKSVRHQSTAVCVDEKELDEIQKKTEQVERGK